MNQPPPHGEFYEYLEPAQSGARPVLSLVHNRPDKRNALTPSLLGHLQAALERLSRQAAGPHAHELPGAVVLCAEGASFCAGFDMALVHSDAEALSDLLAGLSRCVRLMRRLPIPVVVGAHGAAVAGGCALLGGADIVVTDREAKLGYPVVKLGISPAVTVPALSACIGPGGARALTLNPELITGQRAFELGLAHVCCDIREDVLRRATSIARMLASKPAPAMAATKALLNRLEGTDSDALFDRALAASMSIVGTHDQRERVAALWTTPAPKPTSTKATRP
jgi:enoyl-CoA hydratase/carnithine racemase